MKGWSCYIHFPCVRNEDCRHPCVRNLFPDQIRKLYVPTLFTFCVALGIVLTCLGLLMCPQFTIPLPTSLLSVMLVLLAWCTREDLVGGLPSKFGLHMGCCQNEFLLMCAANMKVRHVYFVTTDLSFILLEVSSNINHTCLSLFSSFYGIHIRLCFLLLQKKDRN